MQQTEFNYRINNKFIKFTDDLPETLVSPCLCTGSLALVHVPCLEKWLTTSKTRHCEICEFPFKTKNNYRPIREVRLN